ncbi:hypothetical protein JCGZ_16631 [Jatropha curcas]|uniref:Uncharacterized protein n=1 Tax=Jatropha curcas TaxID=180498 RepID=A0A067JZG3_JATCU|nr:auxin-responsive protein SAUR50 [Jatropha curcas]KDP29242.1 hypothetical protein JCGZ_16631 [Jatropha curcas]
MTKIWRKLAGGGEKKLPLDVPPGHLPVVVGEARKRFVMRADYLNHPIFRQLLDQAYEDHGRNKDGPLAIPCDEFLFQGILHTLRGDADVSQFSCFCKDSTPLLQGYARGSTR